MTISTTTNTTTVSGNGSTTVFAFPYVADSSSDITVTYTNASGTQTVLSSTVYTLFINPPAVGQIWGIGGIVVYPLTGSPIAVGTSLTISRSIPLTQTISISGQGNFSPEAIEEALDTLCMQIQQINANSGTSVISSTTIISALGYTPMKGSNNLSEITVPATARTNLALGTMAIQNASAVAITGGTESGVAITGSSFAGTVDNAVVGGATPAAGHFTTLEASGGLDNTVIGATTPKAGSFTSVTSGVLTDSGSDIFSNIINYTAGPYTLSGNETINTWIGGFITMPIISSNVTVNDATGIKILREQASGNSSGGGFGIAIYGASASGNAQLTNPYGIYITTNTADGANSGITGAVGIYIDAPLTTSNSNSGASATGMVINMPVANSSSNITNGYGINIGAPSTSGGGTITNSYGINIANMGTPGVATSAAINIAAQTSSLTSWVINYANLFTVNWLGAIVGAGITMNSASGGLTLKRGSNGRVGTVTLTGTTAVTVSNTSIATSDLITFSLNTVGGTVGAYPVIKTITPASGFTVAGTVSDTSTYNYGIVKSVI